MVSFTYRRSKSADAYTVAGPIMGYCALPSLSRYVIFILFVYFCSELEYVSYLDAA